MGQKTERFFIYAVVALSSLLFTRSVHAADEKGLYQALHYIPCTQYVEDRKEPRGKGKNLIDEIYITGWLSAYNYMTPNTYDILPHHDVTPVLDWLDNFCKSNPKGGLEGGLLKLTSDLYPVRDQSAPAPSEKKDVPEDKDTATPVAKAKKSHKH